MFPVQGWGRLVKLLTLLCCASMLLGFALLELLPNVKPAAYFLLILGGLLLLICLLFCFMEWGLLAMRRDTTGALSSTRDNAAFEAPSYEEAVISTQAPNSDLGEPPPYSTVIPSRLQEEESNHLAGFRRGRSEGTITQRRGSLGFPISLQLRGHLIGSETPPAQSRKCLEPLTPPPAYDNIFNNDSVFYEEDRTPP